MTHRPQGDEQPDAHLRTALRHAPDHDSAPPPSLSGHILAQARQAAATPRRAPLRQAWLRFWSARPQPWATGALASVLVAGLVGLMWREGPPPEALPGSDAVVTTPPPAPPVAEPAPAATSPPPAVPPATYDTRRQQAEAANEAARRRTEAQQRQHKSVERAPPAATQAPATAAPAPAPAPAAPEPAPAAPPAPPPPAPRPVEAPGASAAPRAAAAAAPALRSFISAPDVLATLLAVRADDNSPGVQRLRALQRRVQGGWSRSDTVPDDVAETLSDAQGHLLGRLWQRPGHVIWQGGDGQVWRAALRPEAPTGPEAPEAPRPAVGTDTTPR